MITPETYRHRIIEIALVNGDTVRRETRWPIRPWIELSNGFVLLRENADDLYSFDNYTAFPAHMVLTVRTWDEARAVPK